MYAVELHGFAALLPMNTNVLRPFHVSEIGLHKIQQHVSATLLSLTENAWPQASGIYQLSSGLLAGGAQKPVRNITVRC
jgi:hypothetical protein